MLSDLSIYLLFPAIASMIGCLLPALQCDDQTDAKVTALTTQIQAGCSHGGAHAAHACKHHHAVPSGKPGVLSVATEAGVPRGPRNQNHHDLGRRLWHLLAASRWTLCLPLRWGVGWVMQISLGVVVSLPHLVTRQIPNLAFIVYRYPSLSTHGHWPPKRPNILGSRA